MPPVLFTLHPLKLSDPLPSPEAVSAVALIALNSDGRILSTQHRDKGRGWDIPGGHRESGEGIIEALQREVLEEVGSRFEEALSIACLTSNATQKKYQGKSVYIFATRSFTVLESWHPSPDIIGRALLGLDEFMERYRRDHDTMKKMIELATTSLYS